MKIKTICNQLRVALKQSALALAVGTAVILGAGPSAHASTITFDFADPPAPNMDGWTSVYGDIWANNSDWGWIADNGHIGIIDDWFASAELAHSPPFKLDGSGDLTGRIIGHASTNPAPPVHSGDIGPLSIAGGLGDGGFIGVALRDVLTDTYVLWKAHPGSDFNVTPPYTDLVFTTTELATYANDGRTYTLDFIDNDKGAPDASPEGSTGKWGILGSATIPGVLWNDNFANAINLAGNSGIQTGTNNHGATFETGEPSPNGETNTVWFKWTCTADGSFTFTTDGSTNADPGEWDSVIGIYTGATVAALTPLGSTPLDTGYQETMTVAVTSGTTYFIQLAGYGAQEAANIKLTWSFLGPQANILAFGPDASVGTVASNAATITWALPPATDRATLHPTFTLSPGATCKVLGSTVTSGSLVNLTNPVNFVVTSGDASVINTYTVTVTESSGLNVNTYAGIDGQSLLEPISNLMGHTATATGMQVASLDYHGTGFAALPGSPGPDNFSVLWEGWFNVAKDGHGDYTFGTASDDGSVVLLDLNGDGNFSSPSERIVNNNNYQGNTVRTGTVNLTMDAVHIVIGYYQGGGGYDMTARFKKGNSVAWDSLSPINGIDGYFTPTEPPHGPESKMLTFTFPTYGAATIDQTAKTISLDVMSGTPVTAMSPTFTMSTGATCTVGGISAVSGSTHNFTNPVDYVVTASDSSSTSTYTVTVHQIVPTGIINVSYEAGSIPAASTLTGPAGGSGQTWNQPTTTSGSGLLDSVGAATSIGWSNTDLDSIDNWGNPTLTMLRSGMRRFARDGTYRSQQFVINGLTVGAYYNVWIASQQPNGEKAKGLWSTTNTTSTTGDQPIDATIAQNTSTWEAGNNYVYFDHVLVNSLGKIVLNGVAYPEYRLPVNGFQLVPTTAPVTDYGTWANSYLPTNVSNPAADADGDGLTNQQEYAFGLNPTSGLSVNPITVILDKATGTFSYTRRATPATTGLTYTVSYSTDLATWTVDNDAISTPDAATPVQTVAVALSITTSLYPQLFVRVQAQ